MSYTVFANSRSVCTKGTAHAGLSTNDRCYTVDNDEVVVPNVALTLNLGAGKTSKTKIAGHPVWTKKGELDPKTLFEHPGVNGGVKTGTYLDKCTPTSCSPDVIVEGKGVVRMGDTTSQNNGNCTGVVMPAALAIALAKAQLAEANEALAKDREAREEAVRQAEAALKAAEEAARREEQRKREQEEHEDEWCAVDFAQMSDAEGRSVMNKGALQVVPGTSGETIALEGGLVGDCPKQAEWIVDGYHSHQATGATTSFHLDPWKVGGGWLGQIQPRTSKVTFRSSVDEKSMVLKVYPEDPFSPPTEKLEKLKDIIDKVQRVLDPFFAEEPDFEFLVGSLDFGARWQEVEASSAAFYAWHLAVGFDPLIGGSFKAMLYGAKLPRVIEKRLGEGGAGAFLEVKGARTSAQHMSGAVTAAGFITLTLSLELKLLSPKVLSFSVGASGTLSGSAKLSRTFGFGGKPRVHLKVGLGPVEGFVKFEIAWGLFDIEKRITIIEKRRIYDKKTELF